MFALPIFTARHQATIVGVRVLNFCVRVDCRVGPPVPIPNTEVKHMYADDSCRVTGRENR